MSLCHIHRWDQVIEHATGEFPKNNTPESVRISGTAYGCECGVWEFQALPGWARVRVTPPPEFKFKTTHRKTEERKA
jgi:hypothetical protein